MKLEKRLYIDNKEVNLKIELVSLKLSLASIAIFTIDDEVVPERYQAVRFDIGYQQQTSPFFEGYIDKIQPAENGHYKITVKENAGILSNRCPLSIANPTMRDVLAALSQKTGLEFVIPEQLD